MNKPFRTGTAAFDISPRPGVGLGGYPHMPRENVGVHDKLYATCLYLENDTDALLLISLDLVKVSKSDVGKWRRKIEEKTGVPEKNILICCTHTHSAPWSSKRADSDFPGVILEPDRTYMAKLENAIIQSAEQAVAGAFDAEFGYIKSICGKEQNIGGNRLDKNGVCDPEVNVIAIKDKFGVVRAVALKYAVHPTLLHGDNLLVSADYPGYIRKHLATCYPEASVMFLQGTAGNQSPRYFRDDQTFEEAERFGATIAKSAADAIERMVFSPNLNFRYQAKEIEVETKKFDPIEELKKRVDDLREVWERKKNGNCSYTETWNARLNLFGAENTYNWALLKQNGKSNQIIDSEFPVEIGVLSLNQVRVVTMQGEVFVEFGLRIKDISPFQDTFTVCLSNGALPGYVCTTSAYNEGGYEAGTSMLTANAGQAMLETARELLKDHQP